MAAEAPVRTTCPYCGVGCGVLVTRNGGGVAVTGDPEHPANRGRLCSKGTALAATLRLPGRLTHARVDGEQVPLARALDETARRLAATIRVHGPDAVAFYVSGQLLTEDYYVANKLMKGFIGRANIDTNSRLCMSSAVTGHQRAFGEDVVPACYDDLEQADLVVLAGSNLAWCHPVLHQRLQAARSERGGPRVVVIDPRRTETAACADLHLAVAPGSDAVLFSGLLEYLRREDGLDFDYLEHHTRGFADTLRAARESAPNIPAVAGACGLPEAQVAAFYRLFLSTPRTVTAFSQGINQSTSGGDKVSAIINVHLATGRIGRPGAGPLSLTGQPNAMGGREVGGLATVLAAHRGLDDAEARRIVTRHWNAPRLAERPGPKAVELFDAVASGRVKAIWIMGTNPAASLPDADRVRAALAGCPLVVVSDCVADTDTVACADIVLPAATWGEKDGTVTNSERRIARQRPFRPPPGEARPDWWLVCEVARRLGYAEAFGYEGPHAIFAEHVALTRALNRPASRQLDLGALGGLDREAYDRLAPVRWPLSERGGETARVYADGGSAHPDGRLRLVPVAPRPPAHAVSANYPLVLVTGRVRDHWHTMTRTAAAPRLCAHTPEPALIAHPGDAERLGLAAGALVRVASRWGEAVLRLTLDAGQRPGSVFAPMHWCGPLAPYSRIGAVVNPAVDPDSGEPEFKHTPVCVEPLEASWHAFVLARAPVAAPADIAYRVTVPLDGGVRVELAGTGAPPDWPAWLRSLEPDGDDWLEYRDPGAGRYRGALLERGALRAAVFAGPDHRLPERGWPSALLAIPRLDTGARRGLLAGAAPAGEDPGPVVCACLGIGARTIERAIRRRGLVTVEAVGEALGAGTGCGSCRPEIARILEHHRRQVA